MKGVCSVTELSRKIHLKTAVQLLFSKNIFLVLSVNNMYGFPILVTFLQAT